MQDERLNPGTLYSPYIGVSCVENGKQSREILSCYDEACAELGLGLAGRKIMVGTATSFNHILGLPVTHESRFTPLDRLADIFTNHRRALNIVHLAFNGRSSFCHRDEVLKRIADAAGKNIHGIQINDGFPDRNFCFWTAVIRARFPHWRVIFNLSKAMENVGKDLSLNVRPDRRCMKYAVRELAQAMRQFCPGVTDILVDASGGKGVSLPLVAAKIFFNVFSDECPHLNVGFAGGLGPGKRLEVVSALSREIGINFSIDAETHIRDRRADRLSLAKTKKYILQSAKIFAEGSGVLSRMRLVPPPALSRV
ncbi:MAG: hypothetical protein WC797_00400 [Candidatus Paceibacterota bacterium]|jgi:hypothetical protein